MGILLLTGFANGVVSFSVGAANGDNDQAEEFFLQSMPRFTFNGTKLQVTGVKKRVVICAAT